MFLIFVQVPVDEVATSVGTRPFVKKVEIIVTPEDKIDAYKPVKLQIQIHACFEVGTYVNALLWLNEYTKTSVISLIGVSVNNVGSIKSVV